MDPSRVRALALRAVDAARTAGATYADVRLTRTIREDYHTAVFMDSWSVRTPYGVGLDADPDSYSHYGDGVISHDSEELAVGVRVLVNGYWGFAASPYWTADEMTRLAHTAVVQATANAVGSPRHVELGTMPVATGSWTMPGIDPFGVSIEGKIDFMRGWQQAIDDAPMAGIAVETIGMDMRFIRQERAVASSEGMFIMQTTYRTAGNFGVRAFPLTTKRDQSSGASAAGLFPQGKGWDACLDAKLPDQLPQLRAEAELLLTLRRKPVQIGRYDVVFDAEAAGDLMDATVGVATQLDRALGYEADAGGTSYLGPDPLALLGRYAVGSPLLTVTANRSLSGGVATVHWDDEGILPDEFTLVQDGVLIDYQTTREQAAWLAPWYAARHHPVRSHGCAAAPSALDITRQHSPNLSMTPGREPISFADLVADTRQGIAVLGHRGGRVSMDFQAKNGLGEDYMVREITNGKLGDVLTNAGYRFGATELWKNLLAIGGPGSVVYNAGYGSKGQPSQGMYHGVAAVPIKVQNVAIIDVQRRA